MKHCKKLLALILVAATLFSLALTTNAATVKEQFEDASEITHAEAVGLLNSLGVINGYEDGTFDPTASVTRAEMAKILAFVLNGGEDVGESYASACSFADSRNHWAKGYIGFCVSAGLINGKSANAFDPNGEVTGYEVCKMLLCALGYKADLNGLTGATWNTSAHSLAIKTKLLDYLDNYTPSAPTTRDDACQMIFNALKATMVETSGNVLNIGDMTIVQDVENTPLVQTGNDYLGRAREAIVEGQNVSYQQLVEDVFPNLKKTSSMANDPFGRPTSEWKLKNEVVGVYTQAPLKTSDTTMKAKAVSDAIGDGTIRSAQIFVNGQNMGTVSVDNLVAKTGLSLSQILTDQYSTVSYAIYQGFGAGSSSGEENPEEGEVEEEEDEESGNVSGDILETCFTPSFLAQVLRKRNSNIACATSSTTGSTTSRATYTFHTEAFFDEATGKVTLINNNYFYGKIDSVRNTVMNEDGEVIYPGYVMVTPIKGRNNTLLSPYADIEYSDTITIPGGSQLPILLDEIDTGEDEETVKVGDYVIFNLGCADRNDPNKTYVAGNAKLLQRITVTAERVSRKVTTTSYDTVVGTDGVTYRCASTNGTRSTHTAGTTYDFICAKLGSRYYVYKTEDHVGNYMYLYNAIENTSAFPSAYEAKLVKLDGSVEIVETDIWYKDLIGSVVTASVNAAGKTVLTAAPNSDYSGNSNVQVKVENSNATVVLDNVEKTAGTNTRFIISQKDSSGKETFTAYTGIHKVPTIQSGQFYAYVTNQNGVLDTLFIQNATGLSSTLQEGIVFKVKGTDAAIAAESTYYELPAVLGNKVTTLKVSKTAYDKLNGDGFHLFSSYTTDSFGNVDSFSEFSGTPIQKDGFTPADAGIIFLNGTAMSYHDNVLVYTYSMTSGTLAESTVESLITLDYSKFTSYYTLHEDYAGKPLAAIFAIIP